MKEAALEITIEKGIPVPPPKFGEMRLPVHQMDIGDSFLIPEGRYKTTQIARQAAHCAAKSCQRQIGPAFKITTRTTPEGLRVWRVR